MEQELAAIVRARCRLADGADGEAAALEWARAFVAFQADMAADPLPCAERSTVLVSIFHTAFGPRDVVEIVRECLCRLYGLAAVDAPDTAFMSTNNSSSWEIMSYVPSIRLPLAAPEAGLGWTLTIEPPLYFGRDLNIRLQPSG